MRKGRVNSKWILVVTIDRRKQSVLKKVMRPERRQIKIVVQIKANFNQTIFPKSISEHHTTLLCNYYIGRGNQPKNIKK